MEKEICMAMEAGVRERSEDATVLTLNTEGPWAKECRWLLKTGKGEEADSLWSLQKECNPADTLSLVL